VHVVRKRSSVWQLVGILGIATTLTGCGGWSRGMARGAVMRAKLTRAEYQAYRRAERAEPGSFEGVTAKSAQQLRAEGYALIGWVSIGYRAEEHDGLVEEIKKQANYSGAHVVRLRPPRNERFEVYETKPNVCLTDDRGRGPAEHCRAEGKPPGCEVPKERCIWSGDAPVRVSKSRSILSASAWQKAPSTAALQASRASQESLPFGAKFDPAVHDVSGERYACVQGGDAAACFRVADAAKQVGLRGLLVEMSAQSADVFARDFRALGEARAKEDCSAGDRTACGARPGSP
jgi:hypothetical protein